MGLRVGLGLQAWWSPLLPSSLCLVFFLMSYFFLQAEKKWTWFVLCRRPLWQALAVVLPACLSVL